MSTTALQVSQETSLSGFDGEVGWRVPVFAPNALTQLRVYAGGYRFAADNVRTVQGPRGRLDLTIDQVPYLWNGARLELGAELQHDTPRDTQAFAEIRLRIPLQVFGAAPPPVALSAMDRRMEDPIERDVDIVSQQHTVVTAPAITETATQTASGNPFTVLSSSSTSGANLPSAVAAAGANSTVLLDGTFNTIANVALNTGQTLTGALTVKTPSGHTANVNGAATISASVGGGAVQAADNSTVSNLTIANSVGGGTGPAGVEVTNVTGVTVTNNIISATVTTGGTNNSIGVEVLGTVTGNYTATIANNTITATDVGSGAATALLLNTRSPSTATVTATVSGNTLNAGGVTASNAFALVAGNGTSVAINTAVSTGNVRQTGTSCSVTNLGTISGAIGFIAGSACP